MNETGKQVTDYDRSQDDLTILQDYTDGRKPILNRLSVQLLHNSVYKNAHFFFFYELNLSIPWSWMAWQY